MPTERRPRVYFGPATIGAICLAIALLATGRFPRDTQPPLPEQSSLPAPEPIAPEPVWLQRHAAQVGLTPAQGATLKEIVTDWQASTAADRQKLESTSADLGQRLDQSGGQRPEQLLSEAGDDYQELSGRLSEARQLAWQQCLDLLTDPQRETVRELRAAAPLEMR